MCIPHSVAQSRESGGRIKRDKEVVKSLSKVSKDQFEKGDPNFKDERTHFNNHDKQTKKSWLSTLFS